MLGAGIPMAEIERTDLRRYLRVVAFSARRARADRESAGGDAQAGKKQIVDLQRGTIDAFW